MSSNKSKRGEIEILIAEDSATQRVQLQHLLEQHGYSVAAATNGKSALEAAQARRPDLIISDIVMPELDGYGLCKAIKTSEQTKDIPVVLLTNLSDPSDVIRGLECGADNFIRKPYQAEYLLARVEYLLMNLEIRKNQKMQLGVEISLGDKKHFITAERQQILDLLISTYEQAVHISEQLRLREEDLAHSYQVLSGLYGIAEGLNRADNESTVAQAALERAMELPGIQAGWISLREGESGFRLAAARNLPPALELPNAMQGDCICRRRLIAGELGAAINIFECERLEKAKGDTRGLRYHASVPLWLGERTLGVMNLVGPEKGLFNDEELGILYSVGNQVAAALERARLHEHLEQLVEERTAKLETEIAQRKRIEKEQARLVAIIEATPDFVATGDLDGHVHYINRAGLRMIGCEPGQDLSGLRVAAGHPDWALKLVTQTGIPHAIEHGTWSGETAFLRPDGVETPVSQVVIAHRGESGSLQYLSTIARDISERKKAERRIERLTRMYAVLSHTNQAIVRARSEEDLFDQICRIAVEHGEMFGAMVRIADEATKTLRPVAYSESMRRIAANLVPSIDPASSGSRMLAAIAYLEDRVVINNEISADDSAAPYTKIVHAAGARSAAALPLRRGGKPIGTFTINAAVPNFYDPEMHALLREMAIDIAYVLDNFEYERRRKRAEKGLAESEGRFRGLVEQSLTGICIIEDGRFTYVNPRFAEIHGYAPQEMLGLQVTDTVAEEDQAALRENLNARHDGEARSVAYSVTVRRKDGSTVRVGVNSAKATMEGRPIIVSMLQDIGEREQAQRRIEAYIKQLEDAMLGTVTAVSAMVELRDPYTAGHERRVGMLAKAIAGEMNLPPQTCNGLDHIGRVHDIGKISIPAEILSKPGRLNALEFSIIKTHPQAGYDILKDVQFPWPLAMTILQHHERIDGSGYPNGLKGDDIIIEARILAVADVIEAMGSHRPYRPTLGIDVALDEIVRFRGQRYDADVVDACVRLFREKGFELPQ